MSTLDFTREYADPDAGGAPPLVVDRQRIVHSAAFRRLQYKTQVFVAWEGDHFRTRLTHTLEVAHLARRIATALDLNADLAEVVGLAHDLGHPPFGHAGERALDECMRRHGGRFEHNVHTLRVVEYLEHPYPAFRGLNLTRVVRVCLAKHRTRYDEPAPHPLQDDRPPPLEGQVTALADRLAYALHDLQDGLYAELIDPGELGDLELWQQAYAGPPITAGEDWRRYLRPTIDCMQAMLLDDVVPATRQRLNAPQSQPVPEPATRLSDVMERSLGALEAFLHERVYKHHRLVRMDAKAAQTLTAVFDAYVANPRLLPPRFHQRIDRGEPAATAVEVIKDYLAGMTDRFCDQEYARLFDPRMGA